MEQAEPPAAPEPDAGWAAPASGGGAGWAAPESGVGSGGRRPDAAVDVDPSTSTDAPRVPVPLRPMTAGDILDGAVAIIKTRPRVVFGVMAVLIVPYNVLVAYLQRDFLGGAGLSELFTNPSFALSSAESQSSSAAMLVTLIFGPLTLSLGGVAIGYLVSAWYAGADPSTGDVLRRVGRRSGVALVVFIIVHLAEGVGALAIGLGLFAVMALSVASSPIVGAEDLGPFRSIERAWKLAGRRFFPVLGLTLLSGLVVSLIGQALVLLPTTLALAVGDDLGWVLLAVGGSVAGLLTTALQAGTATLIYLDLRVRTEGLDLEVAASERFGVSA